MKGRLPRKEALHIFDSLIDDGTKTVGVKYTNSPVILEDFITSHTNMTELYIEGTFTELVFSLEFLQYYKNLVHLDLSRCKLHSRLGFLKQMQRGLWFLKLNDCELKTIDLEQVIGGCHQETLRELDLARNNLSYDNHSENVIKVCQSLPKILVLSLNDCQLVSWPIHEIDKLFLTLKKLPNIVKLNLSDSDFTPEILTVHMMVFKECPSLRYLHMHVPIQIEFNIDTDLIRSFCYDMNVNMNYMRSKLVYIDFSM